MYNLKSAAELKRDMVRTVVKARKLGGSLMVTIPKEVVEHEDIRAGELLEIEVKKARKSAFGLFPGIGPMTREDELDTHY